MRLRIWVVTLAMLVWGNLSFADLPLNSQVDVQLGDAQAITSWIAFLNAHYPQVHVVPLADCKDPNKRQAFLRDLDHLERYLRGETVIPPFGLETIACGAVCGGGDGGKCHTC